MKNEIKIDTLKPVISKSLETTFTKDLIKGLVEVVYNTPNPVAAVEILLGIAIKPRKYSIKDGVWCRFISYDVWAAGYEKSSAVKYERIGNHTLDVYWKEEKDGKEFQKEGISAGIASGDINKDNFKENGGMSYDDVPEGEEDNYQGFEIVGPETISKRSCSIEEWVKNQDDEVNGTERETKEWEEAFHKVQFTMYK